MIIMSDILNRIITKINVKLHKLYYKVASLLEDIYLRIIGVEVGNGCSFRGWVHCFKSPNSKILIGAQCAFNKSAFSNHIGLNHACILATHQQNASILIGNRVGMSSTTINCWKSITIGDNVRIGANCTIMDADFHLDDPRVGQPKEILIEDNVWLGANVVVLKGVHIGNNTIVGMNSVVTKSIPANCIAAGNPCKIIKKI